MTPKTAQAYRGQLDARQIADGMNAARDNALRLLADAELLFVNARYPSAAATGVLSVEELGKIPLLRLVAISEGADLKRAWQLYLSHSAKNVDWGGLDLVDWTAPPSCGSELFRPGQMADLMEQTKQSAIYTQCPRPGSWSSPLTEVDKGTAAAVLRVAQHAARALPTSVREIELWGKHLRGKVGTPRATKAFEEYFQAIMDEELQDQVGAFDKLQLFAYHGWRGIVR